MEEEITVMNSIRHFCFTLTFLGNAVILIHLLNMMQTQMSLAEYKDWKYGQNSLDFLKKNCDFLELCCCCEIYLRSHCMLIIPCKRSVLYGWKKLDVFFPDLAFQLFTVFMLSVIYSMLEMSDIELHYKTKKPTNAFPKKPNYSPVFPQYHETHLSFIQHLSSQIKIIIIIIKKKYHTGKLWSPFQTRSHFQLSLVTCSLHVWISILVTFL